VFPLPFLILLLLFSVNLTYETCDISNCNIYAHFLLLTWFQRICTSKTPWVIFCGTLSLYSKELFASPELKAWGLLNANCSWLPIGYTGSYPPLSEGISSMHKLPQDMQCLSD
jgi:hypothetical protein